MRDASLIANIHHALSMAREAIADVRDDPENISDARTALGDLLRLLAPHADPAKIATDGQWSDERQALDYLRMLCGNRDTLEARCATFAEWRALLLHGVREAVALLEAGRIEQAYACIDAAQALPTAVISSRWDPAGYWHAYLGSYHTQWNSKLFEPYRHMFSVKAK
jgi:hypothetical protein